VLTASIIRAMSALVMEAISTSETSMNFYETFTPPINSKKNKFAETVKLGTECLKYSPKL
jgi:hypothetical protein